MCELCKKMLLLSSSAGALKCSTRILFRSLIFPLLIGDHFTFNSFIIYCCCSQTLWLDALVYFCFHRTLMTLQHFCWNKYYRFHSGLYYCFAQPIRNNYRTRTASKNSQFFKYKFYAVLFVLGWTMLTDFEI